MLSSLIIFEKESGTLKLYGKSSPDDAFEFYVDTFFLELAEAIIEGNFDNYAYARQWSIPISYVEWAKRFLLKERLVVSTHERC